MQMKQCANSLLVSTVATYVIVVIKIKCIPQYHKGKYPITVFMLCHQVLSSSLSHIGTCMDM